jgi:acyl-CoA thioester hydrolase
MFQARLRVIYGDTDQMGVVYYANYLRYFEFARSEFLRAHGGAYRDFEKEGFFLPVVEAKCHYRRPARYDDLLLIGLEVQEVRRTAITFGYQVTRDGESDVLATGYTVHVGMGRTGKAVRLPPALVSVLEGSKTEST